MKHAGKWYPKCRRQQQIMSGEYKQLQVSFDLAPPELNFDGYKVLLYRATETEGNTYIVGEILNLVSFSQ